MLIDVIVNVYGKPWQTLCTLASLMRHSGANVDKIYFTEEHDQPYESKVAWVCDKFTNIIHYRPIKRIFQRSMVDMRDINDPNDRYIVPFQYGIEKSDKKYVFICHTDILFTGDIVGDMLSAMGDNVGIGSIGMCWNCPMGPWSANLCNGEKFKSFNPTLDQVLRSSYEYPPARIDSFYNMLKKNKGSPLMPLPECRLNEFACIIDREVTMKECVPNGNAPLFCLSDGCDAASGWFRSLYLKGYKFANYDLDKTMKHGFYANGTAGYPTLLDGKKYLAAEDFAREYYQAHFA